MAKKPNRVSEADLTLPVLEIISAQPSGAISTTRLIAELRKAILLSPEDQEKLEGRPDDHFSQIVRNIKSHRTTPGNLLAEGFLESIPRGFKITDAGRLHLKHKNS